MAYNKRFDHVAVFTPLFERSTKPLGAKLKQLAEYTHMGNKKPKLSHILGCCISCIIRSTWLFDNMFLRRTYFIYKAPSVAEKNNLLRIIFIVTLVPLFKIRKLKKIVTMQHSINEILLSLLSHVRLRMWLNKCSGGVPTGTCFEVKLLKFDKRSDSLNYASNNSA